MLFSKVEPPYTSKSGCRLVWQGDDEDDTNTIILNKREIESLIHILDTGKERTMTLEDELSTILINSDVTKFVLRNHPILDVKTGTLQKELTEYASTQHDRQKVQSSTSEYSPSSVYEDEDEARRNDTSNISKLLMTEILSGQSRHVKKPVSESDVFRIFATRRSTRNFSRRKIEDWKMDKILAAADTAPTAGNFQGFKIYYVKNPRTKQALIEAANNQSHVNAPAVLVFCMDPKRVKMKFSAEVLDKFSLQDATITAAYAQIAATGLGLSTAWIGMIDEEKVKSVIGTDLRPSSILCIGYPSKKKPPKRRKHLRELVSIIE